MNRHPALDDFSARVGDFAAQVKALESCPKTAERDALIRDARRVMDYTRKASDFVSDLWEYGQRVLGPDFVESDIAQRGRLIVLDLAGKFVGYQSYRMQCFAAGKPVPPLPIIPARIALPGMTVLLALMQTSEGDES